METKIIKIEGHSDLIRNIDSHAVINNSIKDYEAFINKRKKEKELIQRLNSLEQDMYDIKNVLSEILTIIKT